MLLNFAGCIALPIFAKLCQKGKFLKKIKFFLEKATLEQLTEKVKILQEKLVNNDNSQKEINEDINRKMRKKL